MVNYTKSAFVSLLEDEDEIEEPENTKSAFVSLLEDEDEIE